MIHPLLTSQALPGREGSVIFRGLRDPEAGAELLSFLRKNSDLFKN